MSSSSSSSSSAIVFDIETGPLPDEHLRELCPTFEPPAHPGEFDPSAVKYGNLKDEAKRAAKLEECRIAHAAAVANYADDVERARANHFAEFADRAALSPMTGEIVAIGYRSENGSFIAGCGNAPIVSDDDPRDGLPLNEADILAEFWQQYSRARERNRQLVGWNINGFDLHFIWMRSIKLGVEIPTSAWNFRGRWFNWDERCFSDLMLIFSCGGKFVSLDDAARFLALGGKNGEGKDFARLWKGSAEERRQAEGYLLNDLQMTWNVGQRLGVC